MIVQCHRREVLKFLGGGMLGQALDRYSLPARATPAVAGKGCLVGQLQGARVAADVLAAGGNAVDAAVAAALVAGVVGVHLCGIGGYGGHMVIAWPDGKKVTAIDFNSAAPAAARPDMFPLNARAEVTGQANMFGWLAAGVPGTLAGLQLALDRYGTQAFRTLVEPAIRLARQGFEVTPGLATASRVAAASLADDPATARLLLNRGQPLVAGTTFRNPDLADLLETLAGENSVASFYRGRIAEQIAAAFKKHGGLVTADDLAAYQAREVQPLRLDWRGHTLWTGPLTAGGLTVLESLGILKALGWEDWPADNLNTMRARLEAMRLAWDDRLKLLGDPEKSKVPVKQLLSGEYSQKLAARVTQALKERKPVAAETSGQSADGTIHLSAVDAQGMMVALTLTHGGAFGARVTVDGLGLLLGHGMSRFDPRPGRPNSPGPGKRPLHNMCPTIVLREGQPILAVGATGGRRIPNAVFDVLARFVGRGTAIAEAVAMPRMHTEGDLNLTLEPGWPPAQAAHLKEIGYTVKTGAPAIVQAVAFDPKTRECRTASR